MPQLLLLVMILVLGVGCTTATNTSVGISTTNTSSFTLPLINPNATTPQETVTEGPYAHSIHVASSEDGLTFTDDFSQPLAEHVSVPTAMEFPDGTIRIYFVDASAGAGKLGCIVTSDGGETYAWESCSLTEQKGLNPVDFSIIALPDGRYRLYYYAAVGETDTLTTHNINSAISTDGVNFVPEGTVFAYNGLVDPDVFWNGTEWIMHVYSITDTATIIATSTDGTSFTYKGTLSPSGYGVTKPVTLPDGTFRMYGFEQLFGGQGGKTFVSFVSQDGLTWTKEDGTRFSVSTETGVTDPFVIRLVDGTYKMFYLEK